MKLYVKYISIFFKRKENIRKTQLEGHSIESQTSTTENHQSNYKERNHFYNDQMSGVARKHSCNPDRMPAYI